MKMFFKGFGYFFIVLLISVSLRANELPVKSESLNNDTSIAATEVATSTINTGKDDDEASIPESTKKADPAIPDLSKTLISALHTDRTLHPLAVSFVTVYQKKHEKRLELIASKYQRQLETIEKILDHYELPADLKYLAFIESELKSSAVSRKGAVGPWQFMPVTGRLMGLTINQHRDDRRDLIKSTHAAAKYLKVLYRQFDDWLLVIAAYNAGASRVESAIRQSKSRDFWKLQYFLPAESKGHVKKFIAARYILEKQQEEAFPLIDMEKLVAKYLNNLSVLHISGKYNAIVISRKLNMDIAEFNQYNPGFEEEVASRGYDLTLPEDKMKEFNKKRQDILRESVDLLLKNNSTVFSGDRNHYPEAISLPTTSAIVSTAGQQKNIKRK